LKPVTTVDIFVNYEREFRFSFFFLPYLKRLAPNTRIPQHFPDFVWFVITLLYKKAEPASTDTTKRQQKRKKNRIPPPSQHAVLFKSSVSLLALLFQPPVGSSSLDWNVWVTYIGAKTPGSATDIRRVCFYPCLVFIPHPLLLFQLY